MERFLRVFGVKLTRLFAQGPVELELDYKAHKVSERKFMINLW
jgi:hypothetical protein